MKKKIQIKCKGVLPRQGTPGSAGYDLFTNKEVLLNPHATKLVPTGCYMAIPQGYHGKIVLRSSTGLKTPIRMANQVGIIDSDYRGEIKLPLENTSDRPLRIWAGERLCQIIIEKNIDVDYVAVEDLSPTERGEGGFGSTNKNKKEQK